MELMGFLDSLTTRDRGMLRNGGSSPRIRELDAELESAFGAVDPLSLLELGRILAHVFRPGKPLPVALAELTHREQTSTRVTPRVRSLLRSRSADARGTADKMTTLVKMVHGQCDPNGIAEFFIRWDDNTRRKFAHHYYTNCYAPERHGGK